MADYEQEYYFIYKEAKAGWAPCKTPRTIISLVSNLIIFPKDIYIYMKAKFLSIQSCTI